MRPATPAVRRRRTQERFEERTGTTWTALQELNACHAGESADTAEMGLQSVLGLLLELPHPGTFRVRVPYGPPGRAPTREIVSPEYVLAP